MQTYSQLKSRVLSDLARTDLTSSVQGWVNSAEKEILKHLRVRQMEKIDATLTPTSGSIAVPSDFIAAIDLRLADDLDVRVTYSPPSNFYAHEDTNFGTGRGLFSVIGSNIIIRPTPADTQTYQLMYYATPAALTETSQETNTIFPAMWDLYLEGAMWQAYTRVRDMDKAQARYTNLLNGIAAYNDADTQERSGYGEIDLCPPVSGEL